MAGVFTAIAVVVLIAFLVIPWLWAHAIWIVAGIAILIAMEEMSPDEEQVVAQVRTAASFNKNIRVTGESGLLGDGQKFVSAVVHNESNARIYDVWLRCSCAGGAKRWISDPTPQGGHVNSGYHYGYIGMGSSQQIQVPLEPDGLLAVADRSSFRCEPRYEVEKSDLFWEH